MSTPEGGAARRRRGSIIPLIYNRAIDTKPIICYNVIVVMSMSCFHPLKRFVIGVDPKDDRDVAIIRPAYIKQEGRLDEVTFLVKAPSGWVPWTSPTPPSDDSINFVSGTMIRCGKCYGCRMDKSKEWANRCLLELQDHDSAYFVTLTYDQEHVPISYYPHPETGEAQPVLTLRKDDFQKFMKKLRKRVAPDLLRYFACGEYGSNTQRPHYHAIIYGLRLNDLVPYALNPQGQMTYTSQFLQSVWSTRKAPTRHGSVTPLAADFDYFCETWGRIVVAPCTWQTCAYVARYTLKKQYGNDAKAYETFNIEPPFLLMSRHPGIGANYYEEHKDDIQQFDYISVSTETGGRKFRPPYYFLKKMEFDMDEDEFAVWKADRMAMMQEARRAELAQSSLTYPELLSVKERNLKERTKKLRRRLDDET